MSASSAPIDLRRLNYFVHVVEARALGHAADGLNVTQQALSAAIKQLEGYLGVALFTRTGRGMEPTEAGRELYLHATGLLAGAQQAVAATRRAAGARSRPYNIGYGSSLSNYQVYELLEPRLGDIATPIAVTQILPGRARTDLIDGNLDLVVRLGVRTEPGLSDAVIDHRALRLAVNSQHPLAARTRVSLHDLAVYPLVISADSRSPFYEYLSVLYRSAGIDPNVVVEAIHGTPGITSVIGHRLACAFVTDPPGTTCAGRVRVLDFDQPYRAPVQAVWNPHSPSEVRERILGEVSDRDARDRAS